MLHLPLTFSSFTLKACNCGKIRATGGHLHLWSSGLSEEEEALTGVNIIGRGEAALAAAVAASIARQGGGGRVAVVPEGPYVIPISAAEQAAAGGSSAL